MKMLAVLLFAVGLALVAAAPSDSGRIVGGSATTIERYPFSAVILSNVGGLLYLHSCGSTILNSRAVLSAAHCIGTHAARRFRVRVGSTNSNSGGTVHDASRVIIHPNYRRQTHDSDIAVIRVSNNFSFNNRVRAGSIPGANYNLPDNAVVWAIGWGALSHNGPTLPALRHVQVWTINQATCRSRYSGRTTITENMLCSGYLDVGGRDQCQGDSGSPLLHNNIAVGVSSFGNGCGRPQFPGVNARVSRFTSWIQNNV